WTDRVIPKSFARGRWSEPRPCTSRRVRRRRGRAPAGRTPGRPRTGHHHESSETAMIVASQLRAGMAIRYEGQAYKVIAAVYRPGQGQMGGATHVRLQNTGTGTFWEHSFRSELKLEDIAVEKRPLEFLYDDNDHCWFMNPENYEQTGISKAMVGPQAAFLEAGKRVTVEFV